MEIICIDDGSIDGSEDVVDEFAGKDDRIKVIHKTNGGESHARNIGLRMATGDYIAFCDCDDWIDGDMYSVLVHALENSGADMAAGSWYKETNKESQAITNILPVTGDAFGRDELLRYLYMRDSYRGLAYMWDKLYKKEILLDKHNGMLLFDESLRLGGDVVYLAEAALNVKKAIYVDRAFYHYYQRAESGCHTKDMGKLRDWIRAYEIVIQRFKEEQISEDIMLYVKRFLVYHASDAAEIAAKQNKDEAKQDFQRIMRIYEKEYISSNVQHPDRMKRYYRILRL